MHWKFKTDHYLKKKFRELKNLNNNEFKKKFDGIIKIISHYNLNTEQKYEILRYLKKNKKKIKKYTNFKKTKILVLANHYMNLLEDEVLFHGFYRNLFIEIKFGEIDNFNIKKNLKNKNSFDQVLISIIPNYFNKIDNKNITFFDNITRSVKKFFNGKIILSNIPVLHNNFLDTELIDNLNFNIKKISKSNNCIIWDINRLVRNFNEEFIHDKDYFFDNKIFFNPANSDLIADNLNSVISQINFTSPRAIITDLDNTFWKGIIGDDGSSNIGYVAGNSQTEPFYNYQKFLKKIYITGIFLNISSKNDLKNVKDAFEKNNFLVKFKDFSVTKVNWEKKSKNILNIAKQLNISLENVLFIDDNNSERFEVLQSLKKLNVINFNDLNELIANLSNANFFNFKKDNINRTKSIKIAKKFLNQKNKFDDYSDFLEDLKMKCEEKRFNIEASERLSEMTYKTNQFNFTFQKYNVEKIKKISKSKNLSFYYSLKDRFIDHGIIASVNITFDKNKNATLDSFVMSCRVFDKTLENFIFSSIKKKLLKLNVKKINAIFIQTDRNRRFYDFYDSFNFKKIKKIKNKFFYSIQTQYIKDKKNYISNY